MPTISAHEARLKAEFGLVQHGAQFWPKVVITLSDYNGNLNILTDGAYGEDVDVLRRRLVHGIDPGLEDRVGELISKVIGDYRSALSSRHGPDEDHPADEPLDTVRVDLIAALKELFHQEPDLPHEKPEPVPADVTDPF